MDVFKGLHDCMQMCAKFIHAARPFHLLRAWQKERQGTCVLKVFENTQSIDRPLFDDARSAGLCSNNTQVCKHNCRE